MRYIIVVLVLISSFVIYNKKLKKDKIAKVKADVSNEIIEWKINSLKKDSILVEEICDYCRLNYKYTNGKHLDRSWCLAEFAKNSFRNDYWHDPSIESSSYERTDWYQGDDGYKKEVLYRLYKENLESAPSYYKDEFDKRVKIENKSNQEENSGIYDVESLVFKQSDIPMELEYYKFNGLYLEYHENGNLKKKGMITNNLRQGKWEFYKKDGKLYDVSNYENGKRLKY